MTTQKRFILPVDNDGNVQLPKELLERAKWKLGDTLRWDWEDEHHIQVRKVDDD